ncbi:alkanesulfonate monooxygenase SsuD/methylene tetrahydromethanopterin reductase-like flavin-dependent oxidoreductase (luciferase family) [Paraburkholderia sp. BL27I4N3]|uniref:LLM class flavin-dependent oxidoreductase n=1 Tax=Paraburkholderia sp. BL27I4N3 TaxID=1938805 RepID=UPI000E27E28C|nr:LLM class flavin-dependent oxidoreductase [Paraburkholderia sp. BL27I4N3]REE07476.1 alkanesulfonate monooxygenase SsuD/methylene tetrahydromethanopterin reductase-like flavin-dependent oxidoreductase (luciferase family) [Paraburkholderia sp. BL27I4N3]
MRFGFFHLMPYADLDLDYVEKHKSSWLTLPNSYYDPEKGAALYHRYLDEYEYAADLGFEFLGLNEHHQTAYGMMPSPNVLAGTLARKLKGNTKIAILGRALPVLSNPLQVAEEYAILDNLTRGRLIAGFVRGIGAEYHALAMNPTESHARFHEAHDLIMQAWTRPGPFSFNGKYYKFPYVNLWPRPYAKPHPPVFIPSQGSKETIEFAAAANHRYTYLQTAAPAAVLFKYMQAYRDEAERQGWQATPNHLAWNVKIYVGETDAIAQREAKPHIEAFANRFQRMSMEMLLPPGYTSMTAFKNLMREKANVSRERTMEEMISLGTFICGSPQTVIDKLADFQSKGGFNIVGAGLQYGTMPADLTRKNTEMFAREVMPALINALPGSQALSGVHANASDLLPQTEGFVR